MEGSAPHTGDVPIKRKVARLDGFFAAKKIRPLVVKPVNKVKHVHFKAQPSGSPLLAADKSTPIDITEVSSKGLLINSQKSCEPGEGFKRGVDDAGLVGQHLVKQRLLPLLKACTFTASNRPEAHPDEGGLDRSTSTGKKTSDCDKATCQSEQGGVEGLLVDCANDFLGMKDPQGPPAAQEDLVNNDNIGILSKQCLEEGLAAEEVRRIGSAILAKEEPSTLCFVAPKSPTGDRRCNGNNQNVVDLEAGWPSSDEAKGDGSPGDGFWEACIHLADRLGVEGAHGKLKLQCEALVAEPPTTCCIEQPSSALIEQETRSMEQERARTLDNRKTVSQPDRTGLAPITQNLPDCIVKSHPSSLGRERNMIQQSRPSSPSSSANSAAASLLVPDGQVTKLECPALASEPDTGLPYQRCMEMAAAQAGSYTSTGMQTFLTVAKEAFLESQPATLKPLPTCTHDHTKNEGAEPAVQDTMTSELPPKQALVLGLKDRKAHTVQSGDFVPSTMPSPCAVDAARVTAVKDEDTDLGAWLPPDVCKVYAEKGVKSLYRWQVECLQLDGVLLGKNLVYCASTSAGKSLVAEIIMIRRIMATNKKAIIVLPFVALSAEKAAHMEALLEPLSKRVVCFFGSQGGPSLPKDCAVAVCTIEKANTVVNKLLEEGRLVEIAIIVVDEMHMIGDEDRGYLLELLLTKLQYSAGFGEPVAHTAAGSGNSPPLADAAGSSSKSEAGDGLQLVGMSATLPNTSVVATWLHAVMFETNYRPVPLEEYVKLGETIYDKKMKRVRVLRKQATIDGKDPDQLVELCHEVIRDGHSVLIFCSTRSHCESSARHVAKYLPSSGNLQAGWEDIVADLKKGPSGLDPTLAKTVPKGVAYHHAGLTGEEREMVETCFRRGIVKVLCATSTLAAGVNLPARRVIFRQPRVGLDFLDSTKYQQMAGRAGRAGIDTKGECKHCKMVNDVGSQDIVSGVVDRSREIVMCKPGDIERVERLLNGDCKPLQSCLSEEKNGLTRALLEVVAGSSVLTPADVQRFVRCTLLHITSSVEEVYASARAALKWLCHRELIRWDTVKAEYDATPLGRAVFGSSLPPDEALVVYDDLKTARDGFVLSTDLHLLYQVTPVYITLEPDWSKYYSHFLRLSPQDQAVGVRVGVTESFLLRMLHIGQIKNQNMRRRVKSMKFNGLQKDEKDIEGTLRICRRFYVSLLLAKVVQRGMVQGLQDAAGKFAGMVCTFCERLGWHDLEGLISKFQRRVSYGVRQEIVELTSIPLVKASRARALYKANYRTPQAVAEASSGEIVKALAGGDSSEAKQRNLVSLAHKIKKGAMRLVLEKAEEARLSALLTFQTLGLPVPSALSSPIQDSSLSALEGGQNAQGAITLVPLHEKAASSLLAPEVKDKDAARNGSSGEMARQRRDTVQKIASQQGSADKLFEVKATHDVLGKEEHSASEAGLVLCHAGKEDQGPVNIEKMPGGLPAFIASSAGAKDVFFDLHISKKLPRPILEGVAMCWEGSRVHYFKLARSKYIQAPDGSPGQAKNVQESPGSHNVIAGSLTRWQALGSIFERSCVRKIGWDLKEQVKVLRKPVVRLPYGSWEQGPHTASQGVNLPTNKDSLLELKAVHLNDPIVDLRIALWILSPDRESSVRAQASSLEQKVVQHLPPEVAASAARAGRWARQVGRVSHDGCCRRVAQVRALHGVLGKMILSEDLQISLSSVEMPLVRVLADMELHGIRFDKQACKESQKAVELKLKELESCAHQLSGTTFSVSTPAEVAEVLYSHLKLAVPPGASKGLRHFSTDKQALECLKGTHPVVKIIQEHRSLSKLLYGTLETLVHYAKPCKDADSTLAVKKPTEDCRLHMNRDTCSATEGLDATLKASDDFTIYGTWQQTASSTGRLAMEDPNLQCVEHAITFTWKDEDNSVTSLQINPRSFFLPHEKDWVLLSADYSQIEVRLMAHFSNDGALINILCEPAGDLFHMIAISWLKRDSSEVTVKEREKAKRLVYGILYGMGCDALADKLGCCVEEATKRKEEFLNMYPGVRSWLAQEIASCKERGYVATLNGRKRFIDKINSWTHHDRAKGRRQSVNSICQGSAADIIKVAMLNLHSRIGSLKEADTEDKVTVKELEGKVHLLLQMHDELLLEVHQSVLRQAAAEVRHCMESAASLRVPLHVKVRVGSSWGQLQPLKEMDSIL
eukprot:SM000025S08434  [mRNA]  locus=s25:718080:729951:- [translate_table: standard]